MTDNHEQPILMSDRKGHNGITEDGTATALTAQEKERPLISRSIVRRLTPLECERLQGFPNGWTLIGEPRDVEVRDYETLYDEDGNVVQKKLIGTHMETEYFYRDERGKMKRCADSARYKALGNSIAIPFWEWMAGRICAMYDRPVLLGSLFDGIGGFPLAFSRHGAIPVWASEIEEFPIAVTKKHFPEEDEE